MNKSVFELVEANEDLVVVKVKELSNLDIALNPYLASSYDYITVTRGENHTLTIIHKNGSTFSFDWGYYGHTLVSNNLETLKEKVCEFIASCGVFIDVKCDVIDGDDWSIVYNASFGQWQFSFSDKYGNREPFRSSSLNTFEDMSKFVREIFKAKGVNVHFEQGTAITGISVWQVCTD